MKHTKHYLGLVLTGGLVKKSDVPPAAGMALAEKLRAAQNARVIVRRLALAR